MAIYYAFNTNSPEESFSSGFKKALNLVETRDLDNMGLAVSAKGNLGGIITEILGEKLVKLLQKEGLIKLSDLEIHLITDRKQNIPNSGLVLVAFTSVNSLVKVLNHYKTLDVVYIPWSDTDLKEFLAKYEAINVS